MNYTLGLVYAPIWEGQKKPGVALGPGQMEKLGLHHMLFDMGYNFKTYKPKEPDFIYGEPDVLEAKYKKIYDLVDQSFNESTLPIVLGGDHSLAMSSISALLKHHPKSGILWIDAHADINTFETSPTGNIHGMPVAALSGMIPREQMFKGDWMKTNMDLKQIVYLGLRDIDEGEKEILRKRNVLFYTAEDLKKTPATQVIQEAKAHLEKHGFTDGLHISFDIDGLSSELVPATGTPVPNGIELSEMQNFIQLIKSNFQLNSIDCVEFNPKEVSDVEGILKTYNSIQVFLTTLLTEPEPVLNRHLLKKFQQSPVLSHSNGISV